MTSSPPPLQTKDSASYLAKILHPKKTIFLPTWRPVSKRSTKIGKLPFFNLRRALDRHCQLSTHRHAHFPRLNRKLYSSKLVTVKKKKKVSPKNVRKLHFQWASNDFLILNHNLDLFVRLRVGRSFLTASLRGRRAQISFPQFRVKLPSTRYVCDRPKKRDELAA